MSYYNWRNLLRYVLLHPRARDFIIEWPQKGGLPLDAATPEDRADP